MQHLMNEKPLSVVIHGDCVEVLAEAGENTIDAIVSDPPYGLGFMDKEFDKLGEGAAQQAWHARWLAEAFRALKPGGYLLAFGGTRTYHRLACAAEDTGFEIRDCIQWVYGSGFPKSKSASMAIDKHLKRIGHRGKAFSHAGDVSHMQSMEGKAGAVGQHEGLSIEAQRWQGWQTALKPAQEPILMARKPLTGTVAANLLEHGTGAINVDACRIGYRSDADKASATPQGRCTSHDGSSIGAKPNIGQSVERVGFDRPEQKGRWPANIILSHTEDCGEDCGEDCPVAELDRQHADASRFFYTPKAAKREREAGCEDLPGAQQDTTRKAGDPGGDNPRNRGAKQRRNHHPTVKPIAIMEYLLKLVVPKGGVVLDPFLGSGTTLVAAARLGMRAVGIEQDAAYVEIAKARIAHALKGE